MTGLGLCSVVGSVPLRRREARREIFSTPRLVTAWRSILGPPAEGRPGPSFSKKSNSRYSSAISIETFVKRKKEKTSFFCRANHVLVKIFKIHLGSSFVVQVDSDGFELAVLGLGNKECEHIWPSSSSSSSLFSSSSLSSL